MTHPRRAVIALLILSLTISANAGTRRRAVGHPASPSTADALGIGQLSGAALSGTVTSVAGTIVTVNSGGAPAIRIEAANAKILAWDEMPRTIADIAPGSRITAFIEPQSDGTSGAPLPARLITIESRPDLTIAGPVESIDLGASTFRVLGITILVDADTVFATAFPTFAPMRGLVDLAVGNIVKVDAELGGAQILAAHVLVVTPEPKLPVTLRGKVKSISDANWVISEDGEKDVTLLVDDRTKIVGNPRVGDEVQVIAEHDAASNLVARVIVRIGPFDSKEFQFKGWVRSIAPDRWSIGGPPGSMMPELLVRITATTEIYPNPRVDDLVLVKGAVDSSGAYTASSITKVSP